MIWYVSVEHGRYAGPGKYSLAWVYKPYHKTSGNTTNRMSGYSPEGCITTARDNRME